VMVLDAGAVRWKWGVMPEWLARIVITAFAGMTECGQFATSKIT
jgi:hypothetical protein